MGAAEESSAGLIILIQEREHTVLNADNSVARFDPRGVIIVRNGSRRVGVWGAELELNRPNRTTLGTDSLEIGRLDPMGAWEKEFIVKDIDVPMLLVTEMVDTFHERVGVNNVLVFEHAMPVEFTITLQNHSGATIRDIQVTKNIPLDFKNIDIQRTQAGKAKYHPKEGKVVWTIKDLTPERMAVLNIRATITAEDTQPKGSGSVHVSYQIPDVLRSRLSPVLHGVTEAEVGVEKEEHPVRTGAWRCKATLTNTSEFPIRLERVQVIMTAPDSKILYEGTPSLALDPSEMWGHEFDVTAEQPEFDVIALYSVEASFVNEIFGTIEKVEKILPVLRVECSKNAEPLELLAWEPSPIAVTMQARNTGTTDFDEVIFRDTIPAGFEPPDSSQVRARVGAKPITRSLEVSIHPRERDLNMPHTLTVRIHSLTDIHASVKPGQEVTANYLMIARTPKPNYEHPLPLIVEANSFPPGPVTAASIRESVAPVVRVRPVARKLRKTRTVTPGPQTGDLLVTVVFVNEGETTIHEPQLQDLIPPNFEFLGVPEGTPEPTVSVAMNGTLVSWILPTMMSREKFTAQYIYRVK